MRKIISIASAVAVMVPAIASSGASAQGKSNTQRERCAQIGERAVNSQSRKDADTGSVVGALIIGGIIGAVIVNGMNEKSARDAATNKCLAGAGLLSKEAAAETRSGSVKSGGTRMTAGERARSEPGAGPAWARRAIRSQQQQ
jgi:uncharacterized protein YcfJ